MTVNHSDVRTAVASGPGAGHDPLVADHLAGCRECSVFAARVIELDERAAGLAPPPPRKTLPDRILERVATEDPPVRSPFRWQRLVALAAAVALITGVGTYMLGDDTSSEERVLLAAATSLETGGAFETNIEATTEVEVDARGGDPDFSQAPPEVRDFMAAEWAQIEAELERQIAELDARINEMLDSFEDSLDGAFSQPPASPGDRPAPERDQPSPAPEPRPSAPDRASLQIHVRAAGSIDARSGAQLEGAVAAVAGTIDTPTAPAAFAIDATTSTRAVRTPEGAWASADAGVGPLGRVLVDPMAIPSILRSAEGEISVDTEDAGDGASRYRFRVPGSLFGAEGVDFHVVALIARDGQLRTMTLSPASAGGATRTNVTIQIAGRGSIDDARRPATVGGRASVDASSPLAPVSPAVRAALRGESR